MPSGGSPSAPGTAPVGAALLVLGALASALPAQQAPPEPPFTAPVDVDTARLKGPAQPVFFRHDIHAGQYKIDCRYCHSSVEVSANPGIPTLASCMGCHQIVAVSNPEVQKLRQAVADRRPIEWVKVHRLPPFVRFPHMRHIKEQVKCEECHGPVDRMPQVHQYSSLKMGWCLDCHTQKRVTTDCTTCHY